MSLISKIKIIRDAMNPLCENVYHYWRSDKEYPCIVWQEHGEGTYALNSENKKEEQVIAGTIDLFTFTEYDSTADNIQNALNNADGVGWRLNSCQYEDSTNLIHYEWEFEVV